MHAYTLLLGWPELSCAPHSADGQVRTSRGTDAIYFGGCRPKRYCIPVNVLCRSEGRWAIFLPSVSAASQKGSANIISNPSLCVCTASRAFNDIPSRQDRAITLAAALTFGPPRETPQNNLCHESALRVLVTPHQQFTQTATGARSVSPHQIRPKDHRTGRD